MLKRIFISFPIEEVQYRDYLKKQSKKASSPFDYIDMSAKKKWKENEWQKRCRTKIKRSDALIALLSKKTHGAGGQRWEIRCAKEENIPVLGIHIYKNNKGAIPNELSGHKVVEWTWENIENFIKTL